MYEHIFWDFDGTLFDTYPAMANAFFEALKEDGIAESASEIMAHMKISISHAITIYKDKYGIDEKFLARYHKRRTEDEIYNCKPYKEIENICKSIYLHGCKNYLYTHRGESSIYLLKTYRLYDYFCDFVTAKNGFERKPSPQAINYLIMKHNIDRNKAIMIGDRELDILSGKNAGISSCLFTDNEEKSSVADYIVTDFRQLYSIFDITTK